VQLALILRKESLLRGVAELLVIVIGVLIALWADQWWAKRIDRHTEQEYLAALYDDTVATLKRLEQNFEQISRFRDAASSLSLTPIDGPYPPNEELIDLFGLALFEIDFFDHRLSTHQDLRETGRLELITSVDVRRSLADLDASLANVEASQSDLMGVQSTVVDPFLARRTDLATVAKSGYAATDTGDLEDAGYASADSLIGPGIGTDHTGLMRDREFRGALAFRIVILSEQMESYVKLRAQLTRLRAQIESELDPR
jgi:hypothetical protein